MIESSHLELRLLIKNVVKNLKYSTFSNINTELIYLYKMKLFKVLTFKIKSNFHMESTHQEFKKEQFLLPKLLDNNS